MPRIPKVKERENHVSPAALPDFKSGLGQVLPLNPFIAISSLGTTVLSGVKMMFEGTLPPSPPFVSYFLNVGWKRMEDLRSFFSALNIRTFGYI